MDSRLGGVDVIRWQAAGRGRRQHGMRPSTVILVCLELIGAGVAWAHLSGRLPLGEGFPLVPLVLILPAACLQGLMILRASFNWLKG